MSSIYLDVFENRSRLNIFYKVNDEIDINVHFALSVESKDTLILSITYSYIKYKLIEVCSSGVVFHSVILAISLQYP